MKYRSEIDGLRAVAVIPVILFHAGLVSFAGGFVGVDVFFVISGFLITSILLEDHATGRFSLSAFYERRARRILPALAVVVIATVPAAWLLLLPEDLMRYARSLVGVATFSSNILFWMESGYFDTAAELKPLLHTWSLAVEEQFYILFPLILMFGWRFGPRVILGVLGLCFLVSLLLAQWGAYHEPSATFFLLPTRAWELLMGSFGAFALHRRAIALQPRMCNLLSAAGLAAIIASVVLFDARTPFPSVYALLPTMGTLCVILFATPGTMVHRLLSMPPVVQIGLLSYSLYLWHQPVFAFGHHMPRLTGPWLLPVQILLIVLASFLTYRLVEQPFRRRDRLSRGAIFVAGGTTLTGFLALGLIGTQQAGFPDRERFAAFADLRMDTSGFAVEPCSLSEGMAELNYCFGESAVPTAAVIGDSHAADKIWGLMEADDGLIWAVHGNSSCPPLQRTRFVSMDGIECSERADTMLALAQDNPSLRLVLLSFFHGYPLDTLIAADHVQRGFRTEDAVILHEDGATDRLTAFQAGLSDMITRLTDRGVAVVLAVDIPELAFMPADCLRGVTPCRFDRADVLERQKAHRSALAGLAARSAQVHVFDPLDLFCDDAGLCSAVSEGRPLYRDSHHLSLHGSRLYGAAFAAFLAETGLTAETMPLRMATPPAE